MPVTWEFQNSLLLVKLIGDYEYNAPVQAVSEAMRDPACLPRTMLLIDARLTTARRSSEEFRERAIWMASLQARGLGNRCALLINEQPHQFGLARMAATHVEMRGMKLGICTDMEEAARWLLQDAASAAAS